MDNILVLSSDGKEIIGVKDRSVTDIGIPDSVTTIGDKAFYNCESLQSVVLPESVTTIGYQAFAGCISLHTIDIPDSVNRILEEAFLRCESLTEVRLPYNLKTIERSVFEKCTSLKNIIIPSSLTHIEGWAFYKCKSLERIVLPNSMVKIAGYAFSHCSSLSDINIPQNLNRIGNWSFERCALRSANITIAGKVIGEGAFAGCKFLENVKISYGITKIREGAFYGCTSLKTVQLPDSIKTVERGAFSGCTLLTEITLENKEDASESDKNISKMICNSLNKKLTNLNNCELEELSPFVAGMSKFKKDNKYGLVDSDGNILKDAVYNDLYSEGDYIYFEDRNGEKGIMTFSLNELFSGNYYSIEPFEKSFFLVSDSNGPGYGILDIRGNIIVPMKYQDNIKIVGDLIITTDFPCQENLSGYTFQGKKVFEYGSFECYNIWEFLPGYYLCETTQYPCSCYNIIDMKGIVVFKGDYLQIKHMDNGLISLLSGDGWGLADINGNVRIDPFYKKELSFIDGIAIIEVFGSPYKHEATEDGTIYLKSDIGKICLDQHFYWGTEFVFDLCIVRSKKEHRVGVVDKKASIVVPAIYDAISILSNGQILVKNKDLIGIAHPDGQFLFPPIFESIREVSKDVIKVVWLSSKVESWSCNGSYKYTDDYKKHSIDRLYDQPNIRSALFQRNGHFLSADFCFVGNVCGEYAVAYKETIVKGNNHHQRTFLNNCGIINLNGDIILEAKYRWIKLFTNSYAIVLGEKYGLFDLRTKMLKWYDDFNIGYVWDVDDFGHAIFTTKRKNDVEGDRGVLDINGILVPPNKYDYIELLDNGLIKVAKEFCILKYRDDYHGCSTSTRWYYKWGLLDKSGKEVVPCIYSHISDFFNGKAVVCEGGKPFCCSDERVCIGEGNWGVIKQDGTFEKQCSTDLSKLSVFFEMNDDMGIDTFFRKLSDLGYGRVKNPKDKQQASHLNNTKNPDTTKVLVSDSVVGLDYYWNHDHDCKFDEEPSSTSYCYRFRCQGFNDSDYCDLFGVRESDELPTIGHQNLTYDMG